MCVGLRSVVLARRDVPLRTLPLISVSSPSLTQTKAITSPVLMPSAPK